jgi:hypothetical protein
VAPVSERAGSGPGPTQSGQRRNPYLAVLSTPGALGFSVAGFVGRMPMSMYGLGTVLLIASITGRYGLAGTVAAAGSAGYALCAPQAARLADAVGQQRVLRPLAAIFGTASAAFVATALLRGPAWALLVTGGLAGASMPSLGSMVRARWSHALGSSAMPARGDDLPDPPLATAQPGQPGIAAGMDPDPAGSMLHTAFALESVADEVIFVIGPALVTLLATQVYPAAGVIVASILCLSGTAALAAQRRSQPPAGAAGGGPAEAARQPRRGHRLPAPGLITLGPVYLFLGAMFATIDLSTVAFATEQGHRPLAGLILGTYALGSAAGGLWYGSRHWHAPLERRFAWTLCLTIAGVGAFWPQPGLISLAAVIFVSGLTISPTLIAGYGLIERQAPAARRTEGMAWLSSTISVGVAVGSAAAGHIIDAAGGRWGYGFAFGCGAAAAACCLAGLGKLRQPAAAQ